METMSFTINHITMKATSTLNLKYDICSICRENISDKCNTCSQKSNNNSDCECYSVLGTCDHAFHHCCIKNWIKDKYSAAQKCPLCSNKWDLKKRSIINKQFTNNLPSNLLQTI